MGLLDRLINRGAQALGDMVSDKLSEIVNGDNEIGTVEQRTVEQRTRKKCSFDEKLMKILSEAGSYEVKKNVSPEQLENELGREIYVHGRPQYYCKPDNISYGICQNGIQVLLIRNWLTYQDYNHAANREILAFCRQNDIKILDFFEYLPNEEEYMAERIRQQLI